jgi:hypothetical protein
MEMAKTQGEKVSHERALMAVLGSKNGRMTFNVLRDLAQRATINRREFGLTPAARTRIQADISSGGPVGPTGTAWERIESKLG